MVVVPRGVDYLRLDNWPQLKNNIVFDNILLKVDVSLIYYFY